MRASRRHAASFAIALGVGIVAASGGCNFVVGSSDYKIGTVGDSGIITGTDAETMNDGSTNPPTPDGGTPPAPDAGNPPPDTGAPPVDAGMTPPPDGGSTLVCGPSGSLLPNGLPTGDPTFQQLVKSCVLAVSCDPLFFDVTISDCITRDYLNAYLPNDCLAKISSCDDYYACQGSRIATPTECQGAVSLGSDTGTCNGGMATTCFYTDGSGTVTNCAAVGGTCVVYDEDGFGDTEAGCQVLSSCSDPTDDLSTHCASPTQVYTCKETSGTNNLGMGTQTCPQGSACQTTNGISGCLATTASCATAGASCNGGDVTTCLSLGSGQQQYTNKCSTAGLQCTQGLGTASCTAPGCAAGCTETCNGNQLQVCVGGAPFLVDCPSLGLPTCNYGFNTNDDEFDFCSYQ